MTTHGAPSWRGRGHVRDPFCDPTEELTSPGREYYFPHPTDEALETQRGKEIHSRSHGPSVAELAIEQSLALSTIAKRHSM